MPDRDPTSPRRDDGKPPIFIVGCPRSGTTLLREILDSHPSIACGPESRMLWALRQIEERNWSTLVGFGLSLDEWHANVRTLFEAFHQRYAQRHGKTRWADKSPDYALLLDYVNTLYPRAQIVHMVRDPRDVIDAWRRFYGPRSGIRAARAWVRYVGAARRFAQLQLEERMTTVRYEDLVRRPEETLRKLFSWLGEPWDDAVLRFGERRHTLAAGRLWPGEDKPPAKNALLRTSSVGVGRTPYTAVPFMVVKRTGQDLLRAYGYE
jgi:hypothetical protein